MSTVSPVFDASIAGSLANASLCSAPQEETRAPVKLSEFDPEAPHDASASAIACRTRWNRLVDAMLSPISGPTLERARSRAGEG
jgi:hypothetical protein